MGTLKLSDEEKLKRSMRMKELHAQGRAGAQFGKLGGRPRNKRASQVAAEKIAEKGEELFKTLMDRVESENEKVSLDAIKFAYSLEEQERKATVEEEVRYEQLKTSELLELVARNLLELEGSGQIDLDFGEEIEDAELIEPRAAIGTGEEHGSFEAEASYEGAAD